MVELEHHACPVCDNECPPRPPVVTNPTVREAIMSLSQQLAEPHDVMCQMAGHAGNYQGYSTSHRRARCSCPMRKLYRSRFTFERLFDEPEEDLY